MIECGKCHIKYKGKWARRDEQDDSLTICPKCNCRNPAPVTPEPGKKEEKSEVPPVR